MFEINDKVRLIKDGFGVLPSDIKYHHENNIICEIVGHSRKSAWEYMIKEMNSDNVWYVTMGQLELVKN